MQTVNKLYESTNGDPGGVHTNLVKPMPQPTIWGWYLPVIYGNIGHTLSLGLPHYFNLNLSFPSRITKPTCLVRPSVEDVDAGGFKDLSTAKWLALFFSFLLFSSLVSSNVIKPMINQPQVILPFLWPMMNDACYIYILIYSYLVGGLPTPSEKYESQLGLWNSNWKIQFIFHTNQMNSSYIPIRNVVNPMDKWMVFQPWFSSLALLNHAFL